MATTHKENSMTWEHPTGNNPKSICILGLGPTAQDWHQAHVKYKPDIPPVDELWTMNKGFRTVRADMVFVMDDLVDEARRSERYGREIANESKKIPFLTSTVDSLVKEQWPDVLKYPLEDVLRFWGNHYAKLRGLLDDDGVSKTDTLQLGIECVGYMHNTIPYTMAYAAMIGVEEIFLFGCDYDFPGANAHEAGKPNAEHWAGQLMGAFGIKLWVSSRSTFMSKNRGLWWYGFNGRQPF